MKPNKVPPLLKAVPHRQLLLTGPPKLRLKPTSKEDDNDYVHVFSCPMCPDVTMLPAPTPTPPAPATSLEKIWGLLKVLSYFPYFLK